MPERDIVFDKLDTPSQIFKLKEHLRELYRLLDNRMITVTRAATIVLDADEGELFYIELDDNITTVTLKHPSRARTMTIIFKQDGVGAHTVTGFGADVMLAGDAFSVTADASRYTTLTLAYEDENSKWVEIGRTSDVY